MKKLLASVILLILSLVIAACKTAPRPDVSPLFAVSPLPAASAPVKSGEIHLGQRGAPGVKDLPWLLTVDALQAQGYTVKVTELAKGELVAQAMEQGDIDIANVTPSIAWAAVAKGADIRTIVGNYDNAFYLAVKKELQTCEDLNGRSLAFSSRQATGYILFEEYLKEHCPGVTPQILLINQSPSRVAALQAGELDGAYLELEDWLSLAGQKPDDFHVILDFGKEYPDFLGSGFCARGAWAEQHPEMVKDFARAVITYQRELAANPERLVAEIMKLYEVDAAEAQRLAEAYRTAGIWDLNGALTYENIQYTIDAMVADGALPAGLKAEDVADLSYMNAVLDELGRK
jgi:ABC-type nitrate/sulfonate/bicarbonate transport system substrate-binding protein